MKLYVIVILFTFISAVAFSQGKAKDAWFNETYRPQFHFSPEENRMGSPISLLKKDSVYHLFYQWNPYNLKEGYVNWGYATSNNLLKWKYEGITINQPIEVPDSMQQTPWWGTVVKKDLQFFAWVNSWDEGIFRYSNFNSGKWGSKEKVSGLEELTRSEPFVFWHKKTGNWVMVAYNRKDSTVAIYNSPEGLAWNKKSTFNFKHGFVSMVELPVDRKTDDTRWLLIAESGNYMLGNFDGEKFELLSPFSKFDYGRMVGGSVICTDAMNNRTLLISEIKSDQHPDLPANGQLSFPTEINLQQTTTGIELTRKPSIEIRDLYTKDYVWEGKKIYPGVKNNLLQGLKGDCFHFKGVIDLKNCDLFGIMIRNNKENNGIDLTYNVPRGMFELGGNKISFKPDDKKVEFELLIDRSSVELFVDGGRYVISVPVVPEPKNLRYLLYTVGGEIMVDNFEAHELRSAWREEK